MRENVTRKIMEGAISDLIAKYPDHWRQAVAKPILRGWFSGQVMAKLGRSQAIDRAALSYAIDQRAVGDVGQETANITEYRPACNIS